MKVSKQQIQLFLASIVILWLNAGNFEFIGGHIPSFVKFGFVFVWLLMTVLCNRRVLSEYITNVWPLLVFIPLIILSNMLGQTDYYRLYFMGYLYYAVLLAIVSYYYLFGTKEELKVLLIVFFLDFGIVSVRTGYALLANPIIVRAMSTDSTMRAQLLGDSIPKGIGNYSWTYQLAFLIPLIIDFIEKCKNVVIRAAKYLLVVMGLVWLIQAQITFALIIYLVMIFSSLLLKRRSGNKGFFIKIGLLIAGAIILLNIIDILEWAISISNDDLATRLKEIISIIQYGNASSQRDAGSRIALYKESLDAFRLNFMWGNFGSKPFGCHSTVLDLLAAYGMLGMLGIVAIFKPIFRYVKGIKNIQIVLIVMMYVVLACMNMVIDSGIFLAVFVIIPLGYAYIRELEYEVV